ncbi:MAG: efflux RND transporter permease subunit [Thermodesulfobacteriota bacterium]
MEEKKSVVERYVGFLLRNRVWLLVLLGLITGFFCYRIYHLKIATDFFSLYPPRHPYIKLYNEYRKMFGSANVIVCAVEVKEGDIYNWDTLDKILRITKALPKIKGCNASQVISLTHPRLKNVRVEAWGIKIEPVLARSIKRNDAGLQRIRQAVYTNEGIRGFYVSPDDKASAIFAGFWEEGVDPLKLYEGMMKIKADETDENTNIYFTGYPALYAYIYHLAPQVYRVLAATLLLMVVLLFLYFRTWQGVLLPVISAGLSAIWGLGFAGLLGFSLDPLVLVVPLVITARALSHSVQSMARYHEEYAQLGDKELAITRAYSELTAPATLSIVTDGIGVLLISIATIPLMRNLGFFCSFWIISMFVSVPTLNPIVLSFIPAPSRKRAQLETGGRFYKTLASILVKPSVGWGRWVVLVLIAVVLVVGGRYSVNLKVGDTEAGAALLFPDHPYNEAFRYFNQTFVGATQFVIIAEGQKEGAIKNARTLQAMEDFQRFMETEGGAGGTLTFTNMIKRIFRMFHEGHPKWEMLPEDPKHLSQIGFQIENSSAPGEMDRWVDYSWTNATITCFYREYNNELIHQCIEKAKEFIEANPVENVRFRLAGGLLGILAAVNEEVEYSYWASLIAVFVVVFILCILTFRSVAAGFILIIPLAVSQILSEAFMLVKGIDLNINSLPVAAIAVGIGIDYGIYLMARISEEFEVSSDYNYANRRALETTGKAIVFTATTLIAGVFFWIFIDLKFQAEMGLLLALLMFLNMVNALVFIPSLVTIFRPRFIKERKL